MSETRSTLAPANDPLAGALERLITAGTLTPDQARAVHTELAGLQPPTAAGHRAPDGASAPAHSRSWGTVLSEVGAYIGVAFVVAALAVIIGPRWLELGKGAQLAVFAVPALLVLAAAAAVAAGTPGGWTVHERRGTNVRRRLVALLILLAGGLAAGVANVLAGNEAQEVAMPATAAAIWAAGYALCRHPLLHVGVLGGTAWALGALTANLAEPAYSDWNTSIDYSNQQLAVGLVVLAVALVWAALSLTGVLDERVLGLFSAAVVAFIAGEILANRDVGEWVGYLVLVLLAASCFGGYIVTRQTAILAVGVVTLGTVVPQALINYTDGALGAGGALLVVGLSIVGASALGLRVRTTVPDDDADTPVPAAVTG